MKGFSRRLVLKQRQKVTWKWPIKGSSFSLTCPSHTIPTMDSITNAIFLDLDEEPPVFTYCPSDITIDDATTTEVRVNWQKPTATDNSGVEPLVYSEKQIGQFFNVPGSYEVQYTATDKSLNTATCSFRITLSRKYTELAYLKHRTNMLM